MDNTVNDFFNEIDKIVPRKESENEPVWQKCVDSKTGYPYYWNIKTNEVTWDVPKDFKEEKSYSSDCKQTVSPLFPSAAFAPNIEPKIYKIQEDSKCVLSSNFPIKKNDFIEETTRDIKNVVSNIERKVVLLPGYDDTDTESDVEVTRTVKIVQNVANSEKKILKLNSSNLSNNKDSPLSCSVEKAVSDTSSKNKQSNLKKNESSGLRLVSGYGDSDEEEDELKSIIIEKPVEKPVLGGHSILFPVSKPIDVALFAETPKEELTEEVIDTRAFQRKRRIGIDFVNKKRKIEKQDPIERKGFGFKSDDDSSDSKKSFKADYTGFKSGGVMFTKSDIINDNSNSNQAEESENVKNDISEEIEEVKRTLNEKLKYLTEGCKLNAASPVQVMLIQMETLYTAMKAGGLTASYLNNWLKETCAELVKLEKDVAPDGWLLQWDRTIKRYFYRNSQTGKTQWEYPQPDVVRRDDDSMDISTTPPPGSDDILSESINFVPLEPPLPPRIKSPTPPPPPKISEDSKKPKKKVTGKDSTLPNSKSPIDEPLPPGVDSFDTTYLKLQKETSQESSTSNDTLGSALDSFYSDLAAMETEASSSSTTTTSVIEPKAAEVLQKAEAVIEPSKKKKKSKARLPQGLAMKKKGVSKLVERWKNAQNNY